MVPVMYACLALQRHRVLEIEDQRIGAVARGFFEHARLVAGYAEQAAKDVHIRSGAS